MPRRDDDMLWLPGLDWTGAAPAREPADAGERRRALDPQLSFIVQAPAGSGKTELLIQRYLVLLARVAQPESIAAITFTVKAAGEMRNRILDALRKASDHVEPESSHEAFTLQLAATALDRDATQGWNLLRNPERLRVQTIDALSMSITRQMPWLARFGAMPGVVDDARLQYREGASRAIEELGSGPASEAVERLLEHLGNDAARAVDLLASMLATRDHWLRLIGGRSDIAAVREALEAALDRLVGAHLARVRAAIPPGARAELLELARYAAGNVHATDPVIARCARLHAFPDSLDEWLGLAKLLLTGKGEWRKSPDRRVGFPPNDRRMKHRMEALLAVLAGASGLEALLAAVPRLPSPAYRDDEWDVLAALFRLLPRTVAHLRTVFAETGSVDFVEIAEAARRALGSAEHPTDLALSMGTRLEHLLVDEFQDTSVTQFDLLRALTAGWEDDGRTMFLVGDPMQSIYRFRQAEVALFLNVWGGVQPGLTFTAGPLSLTVNFRSARTVVDWVNQNFPSVFPAEADPSAGAVSYTPSIAWNVGSEGSDVTFHPFLGRNDEAEADLVLSLYQQTRRDHPAARTAVLVRSRTHLAVIAGRLREAGISYRAIEIQALAEKPVIQDLLALTRALLHLGDRVAWLAILRAPWCGLTLDALLRIAGPERSAPVWTLVGGPTLDADSATRLAAVRPVLAAALAQRGRVPVAELVERTWIALGGDRLAGANDLADARAYFDLLEDAGARGDIGDLEQLAARVTELFANPDAEADGSLELMTIHKAKGLEFDTVILPGLGKRPRIDDPSLIVWTERTEAGRTDLLMAPIGAAGDDDHSIYDFIRRENEGKNRHESERLLYVACTRARTRLHLIGHVDMKLEGEQASLCNPPSDSLLARIWPLVKTEFERLLPEAELAAGPQIPGLRTPRPLRRVRSVAPPAVEMAEEPSAPARIRLEIDARETARRTGIVTHRLLDRIARDGADHWTLARVAALRPAVRAALTAEGVAAPDVDAACDRVIQGLTRTLDDPRGRWILAPRASARSEFAVSAVVDGEVRHMAIDRTFIDETGEEPTNFVGRASARGGLQSRQPPDTTIQPGGASSTPIGAESAPQRPLPPAPAGIRWIIDFKTSEPEDVDLDTFLESERREYQAQLARYAAVLGQLESREVRAGLYFPMLAAWIEISLPAHRSR